MTLINEREWCYDLNNTLFNLLVLMGLSSTFLTIVLLIFLSIAFLVKYISKKSKGFPKKSFVSICILGIISFSFWISWIYNPNFLPQGYPGQTLQSPNGDFEAQVYHMSGFLDYKDIRVDVVNNQTGKKKMIYYDFVDKALDIMWVEDYTLKIEDKTLNVVSDKFDYRKHQ